MTIEVTTWSIGPLQNPNPDLKTVDQLVAETDSLLEFMDDMKGKLEDDPPATTESTPPAETNVITEELKAVLVRMHDFFLDDDFMYNQEYGPGQLIRDIRVIKDVVTPGWRNPQLVTEDPADGKAAVSLSES